MLIFIGSKNDNYWVKVNYNFVYKEREWLVIFTLL